MYPTKSLFGASIEDKKLEMGSLSLDCCQYTGKEFRYYSIVTDSPRFIPKVPIYLSTEKQDRKQPLKERVKKYTYLNQNSNLKSFYFRLPHEQA